MHADAAQTRWQGRAVLGTGWAAFEGRAGDNRSHAHHALQLALGRKDPVTVVFGTTTITAPGVLIAADVAHVLQPGAVRLLYVERESAIGHRLAATCCEGYRVLDETLCGALQRSWPTTASATAIEPVVGALLTDTIVSRVQPSRGLHAVIASLSTRLLEPLPLATLATDAALSTSRFAHAFKAQTGMAVRPYVRWLRLACALEYAARGEDLTAAAHAAGFADAAHLTRTMQRHFGIAPSAVLGSLRSVQTGPHV